ncbi:hypothetical protein GH733_002973 [Mirounga leonina]|nr:hypothetical protein GH733_002973 [Mirounga leonina]
MPGLYTTTRQSRVPRSPSSPRTSSLALRSSMRAGGMARGPIATLACFLPTLWSSPNVLSLLPGEVVCMA